MNRLFRVDNGNIRRVNITPVEDGFSPKQLAFAHDSTRIPIEYLVLAGWPDYIRTNWEGDSLKHDRLDRKIFREWYETIASEYGDNVIFVIGEQTIDGQARPTLMYPVVPFRVVEGRQNTKEYADVRRLFFYYDSKIGKVVCTQENFSWLPSGVSPFPMNGCKLDPEDLFLLSEPIMYHGYGNMMASKAPKGMDINDVTFHNRKLAWIGFFKGELARRADYRNKGVPEDVGIEKVVRVLGSTNGDSLFSHMPVARFGYIPKG